MSGAGDDLVEGGRERWLLHERKGASPVVYVWTRTRGRYRQATWMRNEERKKRGGKDGTAINTEER